jgi:hypothetical protein
VALAAWAGHRCPAGAARGLSDRTVTGTVAFMWDDGDHMLVNIEPDDDADPHTFELSGDVRARAAGALREGAWVEVRFRPVEYEVIDPDSGPSESVRAEVLGVRVLRS